MSQTKPNIRGVILAAGYGTRFLPASKTVPKELFPLIDKPVIDFIVSEFIDSGIKDILVITSRRKKVLEDYLDREMELEKILAKDAEKLNKIKPPNANIHFLRQREMKGTGDALSLCESFVNGEPFVVAFPDDLVFGEVPLSKQLIQVYLDSGKSVLAVKNMPNHDLSRYGVVNYLDQAGDNIYRINGIIEKPPKGTEPSSLVSLGRYLFTPDIFNVIRELEHLKQQEGEFYQTEIINLLAQRGRVLALDFEGERYDTGEPFGYLKTIVDYALRDEKLRYEFLKFLKSKVSSNDKPIQVLSS